MKYFLYSIFSIVCLCEGLHAQNLIPADFKSILEETSVVLPPQNNKLLLIEELESQKPGRPIKFAEALSTKIDVHSNGTWDTSRSVDDIWRLKIKSAGALSLNLGFEKFHLPEDSKLFVYNEDQSYWIGPFTEEDNEEHGQLWTPIIKGDVIIVELIIPKSKKEDLVLELTKINHDFLGFGKSFSGSCNLDVICGENDGFEIVEEYRDIIKSVGAYHINGNSTCSGVLLNNAKEDRTPYFLTANHCGISPNNAASVVAYWNYENSVCRQPNSFESGSAGDGNLNEFNTGAIYRAGSNGTDFNLIEFDDPIRAEHKPFFAGWNNNFESTPIVIGIHHPGVEEKRISFEFDEVIDSPDNFIVVNDWDIGTTEGGSSGSPIFNEDKQVIGQLRGGLAACSNDLSDDYGSINGSWFGTNGSDSGSLKPWLDPDDTGITEIDGFNGAFGLTLESNKFKLCTKDIDEVTIAFIVETSFTDFVNIELQNLPSGVLLASLDQNLMPGESSEFTLQNLGSLPSGEYLINLISSDGENIGENSFVLQTSEDTPDQVVLVSPINADEEAQVTQEFFWQPMQDAIDYDLEVSLDENFTDIFISINEISDNKYTATDLDNLTQFYWRVRANNYCGEGEWSETFSFLTAQSYCLLISATDVPVPISDQGPAEYVSSLFVDYPILIDNIKIPNLTIQHTYLEDLVINLSNPENDELVQIMSLQCGFNENIYAGFSDEGFQFLPCPPIDGNVYEPLTPFRNIAGINAQGKWDLNVLDTYDADGGEISAWNVEICFSKAEESALIPLDGEIANICLEQDNRLSFFYNVEEAVVNQITLETANGEAVPFELQGMLPLSGSGELVIIVEGESPLVEGYNELYLGLGPDLETRVNVILGDSPSINSISGINNGETLASLETISWTGENAFQYVVYIASDAEFTNIVWSSSLEGNANSIEGPELEDGEYFMVIEATGICGTISSELYNFIIDETVSIAESNLPTLFIRQNVSDNSIILSGNTTRQEYQTNIISVSGHKLLSQDFHEESLHMDVSALIPGVYFVQIKSGIDSTIMKIVIY